MYHDCALHGMEIVCSAVYVNLYSILNIEIKFIV